MAPVKDEVCTLINVIRATPPAYGVCRAEACRKNIEWVTTLKGKKVPLTLPFSVKRVFEKTDGVLISVVDFSDVHWSTCTESRDRVIKRVGTQSVRQMP
jgi:hypothetical protein